MRVLLSTDLITKAGADFLIELAKNGAPELLEALSIGFPSTVSEEIDQMIKALIELADQYDSCDISAASCVDIQSYTTASPIDCTSENTNFAEKSQKKSKSPLNGHNDIVPQALDESHSQFSKVFSKCVDILLDRKLISSSELYKLVAMSNEKESCLLSVFDSFYKDKDLDGLIDSLLFLLRKEEVDDGKSEVETTCEKHCGEDRPESASTKSVDITYDESLYQYSKSAPTEVKHAAEAFVSDLFGWSNKINQEIKLDGDPLVSEILKEVKEWDMSMDETIALKSCIERKDLSLQVALNSFRANPDVEDFGLQLKKIAQRVIEAEGFVGLSTQ